MSSGPGSPHPDRAVPDGQAGHEPASKGSTWASSAPGTTVL